MQEAIANRPEILEADAQIAAARKGIQLARRSLLPSLNLSVSVQYSPNAAGFSPQTTTGSFVAALSFPLYDGGVSGARVTQARADVATAETNRRQAVDLVNLDVRTAYLNLLQSRDRVAVANQALSEAVELYRLARVRYTNGVSTLVEVSDAQNALTQAQNNQVNALYDYNNNRASLDKAAGRYAYLGQRGGFSRTTPTQSDRQHGQRRTLSEKNDRHIILYSNHQPQQNQLQHNQPQRAGRNVGAMALGSGRFRDLRPYRVSRWGRSGGQKVTPVKATAPTATQVSVTPARIGSIAQTQPITGALSAQNDVTVGAKLAGKVVAVYYREGAAVKAGADCGAAGPGGFAGAVGSAARQSRVCADPSFPSSRHAAKRADHPETDR